MTTGAKAATPSKVPVRLGIDRAHGPSASSRDEHDGQHDDAAERE